MRRLLIRPGGIGDSILSFPALEHLRADYTEVWVRGDIVPLIQFADSAGSIASTGLDLLELPEVAPPRALVERLRSFDSIVSWYGSNRPEFRERTAALGLPFQFLPALPPPGELTHAADFFLKQAGGSGTANPRISCSPVQRQNFAVIHPFSGSAGKNWPLDRYRELAKGLNLPVQWCAGPEEHLHDAVRMDNLWDLARWLASARIYIGNDSGITHLASAAGVPVVAIFGPTDPELWAPRGDHVRIVSSPQDVGGVLDAAHALLRAAVTLR